MAFEIKKDVLKKYIPEAGETEIVIPEGVTEIAKNIEFGCIRIVIPKSLKSIGKGCFHQTVSFDCQYNNAILVIYGVEIDLTKIFLSNIRPPRKLINP